MYSLGFTAIEPTTKPSFLRLPKDYPPHSVPLSKPDSNNKVSERMSELRGSPTGKELRSVIQPAGF
jgi:hypothetical protein